MMWNSLKDFIITLFRNNFVFHIVLHPWFIYGMQHNTDRMPAWHYLFVHQPNQMHVAEIVECKQAP
jgi:hypothetical protein